MSDHSPQSEGRRSHWRQWLPLIVLIAAIIAVWAGGAARYLTLSSIAEHRDGLKAMVEAHYLAALGGYMLVYFACIALSLPGAALLTILGGFLFGWITAGWLRSLQLRSALYHLSGREKLASRRSRPKGRLARKDFRRFRRDAFHYMLFLRLVPVFPFWLVNIAPALPMSVGTYALTTFIGIIPATFAFSILGSGLDSIIIAQKAVYQACVAANGAGQCSLPLMPAPSLPRNCSPHSLRWASSPSFPSCGSATGPTGPATVPHPLPCGKGTAMADITLRYLRDRRWLGRPVGCCRRGPVRRKGGPDRKGPDGRRLPQLRLRAVQGPVAAARHAHAYASGGHFGIGAAAPKVDFAEVMAHVHDVIAAIAPMIPGALRGLGVTVIRGPPASSRREVEAAGSRIQARRFVISTGSRPSAPPIPGLDEAGYLTNETLFENRDAAAPPRHYRRWSDRPGDGPGASAAGAEVTVLEAFRRSPRMIPS